VWSVLSGKSCYRTWWRLCCIFANKLSSTSATSWDKKLSYRRESATRLSRLAQWSCTSLNTAPVAQLYKIVTHLKISEKWCCIMWIITKFSGSTPVRRPLCSAVNPGENSHMPHMLSNHNSLATILSLRVKAHVHSETHGQLRKPQHTYVKRAVCTAHFKLNPVFKVI